MGMPKRADSSGEEEVVSVPAADEMDDETFLRHLEKRHAAECRIEQGHVARLAVDAWIGVYRVFHERLHRLQIPHQYDHEHEEFE